MFGASPGAPGRAAAQVKNDFRSKNLDWTVKVDPDALLLPDRLRRPAARPAAPPELPPRRGAG